MISKRYQSTKVDRRTWLHMLPGTLWSTSSTYSNKVVEIWKMNAYLMDLTSVAFIFGFAFVSFFGIAIMCKLKMDKASIAWFVSFFFFLVI